MHLHRLSIYFSILFIWILYYFSLPKINCFIYFLLFIVSTSLFCANCLSSTLLIFHKNNSHITIQQSQIHQQKFSFLKGLALLSLPIRKLSLMYMEARKLFLCHLYKIWIICWPIIYMIKSKNLKYNICARVAIKIVAEGEKNRI